MSDYKTLPDLPGWEIYADGRIKSSGRPSHNKPPMFLKFAVSKGGYYTFSGPEKQGRQPRYQVHTTVCRAFHGEKPAWAECIRHLNGIRTDNRPSNLAWGTLQENSDDRVKHGQSLKGILHPNCKFSAEDIQTIKEMFKKGCLKYKIAEKYNVSRQCIYRTLKRELRTTTL